MSRGVLVRIAVGIVAVAAFGLAYVYVAIDSMFNGSPWERLERYVEHVRTHTVLEAAQTIDGVALPAGTEVAWEDRSRRRMVGARLAGAATVLGVRAGYLRRAGDGEWVVDLLEAREVDGWPCADGEMELTTAGRLVDCMLSREVSWLGWELPAGTSVRPREAPDGVGLTLPFRSPAERPLESPVVGGLPWAVTMNDDGSPDSALFDRVAPHVVGGQVLAGVVAWEYAASSHGMGRARRPVSVSGFAYEGDGTAMNGARRRVVVPWPAGDEARPR